MIVLFSSRGALIGTLLGQTSRLRFMPNVANLPLRPPAMPAKTIAALDFLSGGRFELGLGGGRLWPQIAGLGGPRRTPDEVVGAVEMAMIVLRSLWQPGKVARFQGVHYSLTHATTSASGSAPSIDRPRTGPGGQPIRTRPDGWARIIAGFVHEERFDAVNFVPEAESQEQLTRFGTEVIPAARAAIGRGADRGDGRAPGSTTRAFRARGIWELASSVLRSAPLPDRVRLPRAASQPQDRG